MDSLYIAVDLIVTDNKKYLIGDYTLVADLQDCIQLKILQDCQMFIDENEALKRRVIPLKVDYLISHLKTVEL